MSEKYKFNDPEGIFYGKFEEADSGKNQKELHIDVVSRTIERSFNLIMMAFILASGAITLIWGTVSNFISIYYSVVTNSTTKILHKREQIAKTALKTGA